MGRQKLNWRVLTRREGVWHHLAAVVLDAQPEILMIAAGATAGRIPSAWAMPETLPEAPPHPDTEPDTLPAPPQRKGEPEPFEPDWPAGRPEPQPKA